MASTSSDNTVTYDDDTAPTVSISSFTASAGQSATISGLAGIGFGDNSTVTVVLCTHERGHLHRREHKGNPHGQRQPHDRSMDCDIRFTRHHTVLYARAKSSDLSGNLRTSTGAGPIAIP